MSDRELDVMAHRYLYYVLARPVIGDSDYDRLEKAAAATAPADSPVHQVGSSLDSDYSDEIVERAFDLLDESVSPS